MKILTTLLLPLLLCTSAVGQEPDRAKIANIEEIFRLTKVVQMQQQILTQMKGMIQAQLEKMEIPEKAQAEARETQDRIFTMIFERLSWDKLKVRYVQLYDETYTASEIVGILDFYKSPAGRAMLEKMPVLMSKSISIAQEQMTEAMPEVQRMMEELAVKYKHPATDRKNQ